MTLLEREVPSAATRFKVRDVFDSKMHLGYFILKTVWSS